MINDHVNATEAICCFNRIIGKNINAFKAQFLLFLPKKEILLLDIGSWTPSKMKSGKVLSIYDFVQHNFFCPVADAIHSSDPCHLVTGFRFLSHALSDLHLLNNQGQTLLSLLFQIGKVSPDLAVQNQIIEHHWIVLFQILSVHPPIFSDGTFLMGQLQIRDIVISNQHIVHIVDTLFVFHMLGTHPHRIATVDGHKCTYNS